MPEFTKITRQDRTFTLFASTYFTHTDKRHETTFDIAEFSKRAFVSLDSVGAVPIGFVAPWLDNLGIRQ
jgi:hypothetical protein